MIVRTKKEFRKQILKMEHPVLESQDLGDWIDNLSMTCFVYDKKNVSSKFLLPTIRLKPRGNITQNDLNDFYKKEKAMFIKYERWLHEFFGNYCTSKLKMRYP